MSYTSMKPYQLRLAFVDRERLQKHADTLGLPAAALARSLLLAGLESLERGEELVLERLVHVRLPGADR